MDASFTPEETEPVRSQEKYTASMRHANKVVHFNDLLSDTTFPMHGVIIIIITIEYDNNHSI
jgi:hypothetical protein